MTDFEDRCADRLSELMQGKGGGDMQVGDPIEDPFKVTDGGRVGAEDQDDHIALRSQSPVKPFSAAAIMAALFQAESSTAARDGQPRAGTRKLRAVRKRERQNRKAGRRAR